MAIKKEIWQKAQFFFELGKSLGEIESATGIDRSTISKKAKKEGWDKSKNQQLKSDIVEFEGEKSTLEAKKSTLVEKTAQLNDFEITMLDGIVENEVGHKSLVFSTQALALIRTNQILTDNKKTVMLKVQQYGGDGQRIGENYEPFEVPLSAGDVRDCVETADKASITLGLNPRHAPKIDVTQLQQQTASSDVTVVIEEDKAVND